MALQMANSHCMMACNTYGLLISYCSLKHESTVLQTTCFLITPLLSAHPGRQGRLERACQ